MNIFSITNDNTHKILTIFGIKFKFKNNKKEIINSIEELKIAVKQLKNDNRVAFIFENFNNPDHETLYNDLYKTFTIGECMTMKNIYIKRINKITIEQKLIKVKEKYTKKICLLTDLDENFDCCNVISIADIKNFKNSEDILFLLAYNFDYNAILAINELQKYNMKYLALEQYGTPQTRYFHTNKNAYKTLIEEYNNDALLHFCPVDFENIFQAIEATKKLQGDFVEIGTFQGASARATLNYLKRVNIKRKCYFIDTYEGFTYTEANSTQDIIWTNTHTETSIQKVDDYLSSYDNYELVKSNIIQDELPDSICNIVVANIDVDMYEAVKAGLYKVKDRVVKNGIIIAEDYGHTPALIGAQKAVDEFLEENPNDFIPIYMASGQMFLIKK